MTTIDTLRSMGDIKIYQAWAFTVPPYQLDPKPIEAALRLAQAAIKHHASEACRPGGGCEVCRAVEREREEQ